MEKVALPGLPLRVGSGDGINVAQRVMDFGDGGHILLSSEYLGILANYKRTECHDIGETSAKHGRRIHLFNYYENAIGNASIPQKLRTAVDWKRPACLGL